MKFGFEDHRWDAAKVETKAVLGGFAKRRETIAYSDFVVKIEVIRLESRDPGLRWFLGEISREEERAGRGMLTALVVHRRGDYQPGPGFFELVRDLGKDTSDSARFWIDEVKRLFEAWEGNPP